MSKFLQISILIFILILTGCSAISSHDDNQVAAVVMDQKITIGDLRFLYPDDTALDYLNWAITLELIKHEVKQMSVDITPYLNDDDDWFSKLPPKDTNDPDGKQIRKFAKSQGKKLKVSPEEFQKEYAEKVFEQNAYLTAYLEANLGEIISDDEKEIEEFNMKGDALLEELRLKYEDDIIVLIN